MSTAHAFGFRFVLAVLLLLASLGGSSCFAQESTLPGPSMRMPQSSSYASATIASGQVAPITDEHYHLGMGDKLRVTVYGEEDLSGEFLVDGSGQVQLPLVGQVKAAGLTIHQFISEVTVALKDGYLRDPRVSVEVLNYRPFYIIGEVNKPGEYPYENGLNILGAVALAGGFTYRANDNDVYGCQLSVREFGDDTVSTKK